MKTTRFLTLLAAVFASAATAAAVHAAPAPDSAQLARLQQLARSPVTLQVTTDRGTFLLSDPRIDAGGLATFRDRAAMFGPPDARSLRRVRWDEIEHLDVKKGDAAAGALRGGLVGALVGFGAGYLALSAMDATQGDGAVIVPVLASGSGALLGSIVGALTAHRSERVYP